MANCEGEGGNDIFVAFRGCDAIIKRFDHVSPVSRHAHDDDALWPGIYESVPTALDPLPDDDLFSTTM